MNHGGAGVYLPPQPLTSKPVDLAVFLDTTGRRDMLPLIMVRFAAQFGFWFYGYFSWPNHAAF
jgi:hypothetical protein